MLQDVAHTQSSKIRKAPESHCFLLKLSDQVNQFTDSEQLEFGCWSRSPAPCFLFSADAIS